MVALWVAAASLAISLFCLCKVLRIEAKRGVADGSHGAAGGIGGGSEELANNSAKAFSDDKYRPYESSDKIFVARLEELVEANLSNHDLNVDFLAAGMMVSRSLLFNRVRRATGKGIVEFVNGIRIERSIDMFSDADKSLTEIAELSGFSTLRYYSRVFKSIKGEIPSVYRDKILSSVNKDVL